MSGNSVFVKAQYMKWNAGFANLFRAEMSSWWKTRTWWVQTLIWTLVVNGLLLTIANAGVSDGAANQTIELAVLYGVFGGFFTAIGVVIIMQSAIVGEKISGTAAWVLSKPVSRASFILAKWSANTIGILVTSILIPGFIAYFIFVYAVGANTNPSDFTAGILMLLLFNLFWISLTLMLGTFFDQRGAVIGIPLALILGQQFILAMLAQIFPKIILFTPFPLVMPELTESGASLAASLIAGIPLENSLPVASSMTLIVLFLVLALWRFNKEEL